MNCRTCGRPLPPNASKAGRKKEHCSNHCRDFQKYKQAMERELEKINPDDEHRKIIRGDLFAIANSIQQNQGTPWNTHS